MASLQVPLTTLVQFVDPKTGFLTDQGRTIIQQLIDRTGGPTGGQIVFASGDAFGAVAGTISRVGYLTDPPLPVGAGYSQAEVTAIATQLTHTGVELGALVDSAKTAGLIS